MWHFLTGRTGRTIRGSAAVRHVFTAFMILANAALAWSPVPAHAGPSVVVRPGGIEPPVLNATTGQRVEFENRTGRAVHLEFEGDSRQHEVVQAPATGPFWVVFLRPGTHRYVVHVYAPRERTLAGVVEVAEDPQGSRETLDCDAAVPGVCVER